MIRALVERTERARTSDIAAAARVATKTASRYLEDMEQASESTEPARLRTSRSHSDPASEPDLVLVDLIADLKSAFGRDTTVTQLPETGRPS
jgi:hypothetical protein